MSRGSSRGEATTNRVKIIRVPGAGKVLKAQRSADGTIHLLADAADGPQYLSSKDDGRTFSVPIPIVDALRQMNGRV